MICRMLLSALVVSLLGACATNGVSDGQMVSQTGNGPKLLYSKYYDLGVWLDEGKLGLQVAVDHGTTPNPRLVVATGEVTVYLVNLDSKPRDFRGLSLATAKNERSLPRDKSVTAVQRARTRVPLGQIPIFDYGTEIPIVVNVDVDGIGPQTLKLTVPRLLVEQLSVYGAGAKGRPPYPWFKEPYFPFNPPISIVN